MTLKNRCNKQVKLLLLFFAFLLMSTINETVIPQRLGIAYEDYMRAIGWEDDFLVMKNILKNELKSQVEGEPNVYYEDNANFFSMVLLLSGVKPTHYYKLQQNGVDVINAITANVRPFDEQSLLSDVAIIGTVTEVIPERYGDDGFDISVTIDVSEVLKGEVSSETLIIRQRNSSRLPGSDNKPDLNQTYLFLLSSGMYGYHKANHQMQEQEEIVVSPPTFGQEDVFVIYRLYPYRNGQLLRSPQNREIAFKSLRFVDQLLRQD